MEFVEFDKFLGFYVNLGLIIIEFGLEKKSKNVMVKLIFFRNKFVNKMIYRIFCISCNVLFCFMDKNYFSNKFLFF